MKPTFMLQRPALGDDLLTPPGRGGRPRHCLPSPMEAHPAQCLSLCWKKGCPFPSGVGA